jgi:outer membrane protein assembly factor BamB
MASMTHTELVYGRMRRALLALLALVAAMPGAFAQEPIIVESTGKPAPPPPAKPKPKPQPTFVKPTLLWKTLLRRMDGAPVVQEDELYAAAAGALFQLDYGGRTQWASETGGQPFTATLDDKRVFVGSDKGILYAVTRRSGQSLWKYPTENGAAIQTRPAVGDGRVYFEANDNNVYAVSAANGQLKWKFVRPDGSLGYSSPVYDGGALYVAGESAVYRMDGADGKEAWHAFVGGKSLSTPALSEDTLFVGGDDCGLTALSRADGKMLWSFKGKPESDWFGPPLVARSRVYVTTYAGHAYAVDAATGKQRWDYRLPGSALATPALDAKRNVLYVTSSTTHDAPTLTALDARSGKRLWDYALGSADGSPVVVGDRLYVGATNGYLYAFALK